MPNTTHNDQGNQPTIVLLMAYMRGGSSFFGSTFSMNEDVFYFYEPVWDVYNSFLASPDMLFPIHTSFTSGGVLRELSTHELDYVSASLVRMFNCDFDQLRLESLNKGWTMNSCHTLLHAAHDKSDVLNTTDKLLVQHYKACLKPIRIDTNQCLPQRIKACKSRSLRVAKVLRLRMRYVEDLIQRVPNVKVIHQLRDPRGTVLSRRASDRLALQNLTREAELLCSRMAADIRERRILQAKYPGVFLETKYEDLATNLDTVLQRMYSHIGRKVPEQIYEIINGNSKPAYAILNNKAFGVLRQNPRATSRAWKNKMKPEVQQSIAAVCQDLFQLTGYR